MAKTVILVSSDGEWFEIPESVAAQSTVIRNVIEDVGGRDPIPLFNVTARVLVKVIAYLKNHGGSGSDDEKKKNDDELVSVPVRELLECMMAANYLNIESLVDLASRKVADSLQACNSVAEMRGMLGMANDYSPEEEAWVMSQNQWAFLNGN
ncbi:SKP1-like protein 4 [Salvia divinorum]|uniref:SKP1-like protein n=1 Tax=Salvia divinorum TaxID=28513 RepID=A0ABD1FKG5_SALDI